MKILDSIMKRIGYRPAASSRRPNFRMYAGAESNRLTADWPSFQTSQDQETRFSLPQLRNRARQLSRDEAMARRYLEMVLMNVVGPDGFTLQMKVTNPDGTSDKLANAKIEEAWADWSRREICSVVGNLTFRDVCNTVLLHAARDGEFLVRKVFNSKSPYGFQLQILQPEYLNHLINETEANGNITRMGVEFDSWRRPVAYHLTKIDPALEVYASYQFSRDTERIDGGEIYHGFRREHAFQSRGVSWMAPVMLRMKWANAWEEAALWNARAAAGKMGIIETDPNAPAEEHDGDDVDEQENTISSVEPGVIEQLARGQHFVGFDPKYPEAQHEMFIKAMRRAIASGLNVSYNALANDLEGVNFSSIRAGLLDERENWKSIQRWFIDAFLRPVFSDWLESALLSGTLNLPLSKIDKFDVANWVGRRWQWVDPLKDVEANILARQAGFASMKKIISEQGGDIEETFAEIKAEMELAKEYGLKLKVDEIKVTPSSVTSPAPDAAAGDGNDGNAEPTPAKKNGRMHHVLN